MPHTVVDVRTEDGTCATHVFTPAREGTSPGVVMFMDAPGLRRALFDIAQRLAESGYHVLLPNLYYRTGFEVPAGKSLFGDKELNAYWKGTVVPTLTIANIMRDMTALITHLPDGSIGTVGYCMGGKHALASAAYFPDRVRAAASYHGGGLATDAPDSVHRLAPKMKARVYVAGAIEDSGFDDAQKARLEQALTDAHVDHVVETYNARHGWVPADMPTHNAEEAEHHWQTLLQLFGSTL